MFVNAKRKKARKECETPPHRLLFVRSASSKCPSLKWCARDHITPYSRLSFLDVPQDSAVALHRSSLEGY
jgi:hypothetical protein